MDEAQTPEGTIVVGVDGSPWSDDALDWAADQAALEERPLTLVHALEPLRSPNAGYYASAGVDYGGLMDELRTTAEALLSSAVARAVERHPDLDVHRVLSFSDPRGTLLDLGERAAMIVVGSRGRGPISSLLLGSVSVSVAKHAACPVVVLRPHEDHDGDDQGRGILLGVDGTGYSVLATDFAFRIASFRRLPLTVLHSYLSAQPVTAPTPGEPGPDLSEESSLVSEALAGMGERFPEVEVEVRLVHGFADHQLIKVSSGYDLVVVGHHRTTPLANLVYGSVAPTVLENAKTTVAVVPGLPVDGRHPDAD